MIPPLRSSAALLLAASLLGGPASDAAAFIEEIYSVKDLVDQSSGVAVAVVDTVDSRKKVGTFKILETLKGTWDRGVITLSLMAEVEPHSAPVTRHLVPGAAALFLWTDAPEHKPAIPALCYVNRFFFQLWGHAGEPGKAWQLCHFEPGMRRTHDGSVEDLTGSVRGYITRGIAPPAPDPGRARLTIEDSHEHAPARPVQGRAPGTGDRRSDSGT